MVCLSIFVSSWVSFIRVFQCSACRSSVSLGSFIPRHLILSAAVIKGIVFLTSLFDSSYVDRFLKSLLILFQYCFCFVFLCLGPSPSPPRQLSPRGRAALQNGEQRARKGAPALPLPYTRACRPSCGEFADVTVAGRRVLPSARDPLGHCTSAVVTFYGM